MLSPVSIYDRNYGSRAVPETKEAINRERRSWMFFGIVY